MKRTKEEQQELANEIKKLYNNGEGLTFAHIGAKIGVSESYAHKLYHDKYGSESEIPKDLINMVGEEINGMEEVTIVFFNPNESGNGLNQLTITTEIESGLTGEKRKVAIVAALQKQQLVEWCET